MTGLRVFDASHYRKINKARLSKLRVFIRELTGSYQIKSALDVGCGVGYFSSHLAKLGLETTGFDARSENVAEARNRYPGVRFHINNIEAKEVRNLGLFDFVLCFGVLYHLENPFSAIRNLHAMTGKALLVESMVVPYEEPVAALIDESPGMDQSLAVIAFVPSESCLVKMLYSGGFQYVYHFTALPNHEDYRETTSHRRRRTMLVASQVRLRSQHCVGAPGVSQSDLWKKV